MDAGVMPAAAQAAGASGRRDERIDFLRGVALIFIFIDHVPDSLFSLVSLRAFAFADAAELFFFLSGFVAAMVYGRIANVRGFFAALRKVWRRAGVLYAAQALLFGLLIAEVLLAVTATGHGYLQDHFRIDALLSRPGEAIVQALMLRYQPAYLDVLPVYVVLLAAFPFALFALARSRWLVLVPSAALYLAVHIWSFRLHTFPDNDGWFFDPLAWQFMFLLGAALGHPRWKTHWTVIENRWLLRAAILFAAIVAAMQIPEALRMIWPHIPGLRPGDGFPIEKSVLDPLRIASFLALALIARRYVPNGTKLTRLAMVQPVIRCGQHSLQIFCMGVLLSAAGWMIAEDTGHSFLIQTIVSLGGIFVLLGFAYYLENLERDGSVLRFFRLRRAQPA